MIPCPCPKCQEVFQVPDHQAGAVIACPWCGQRFQVPTPSAQLVAPEPRLAPPPPPTLTSPAPQPAAAGLPREAWWLLAALAGFGGFLLVGVVALVILNQSASTAPVAKGDTKEPANELRDDKDSSKPKPHEGPIGDGKLEDKTKGPLATTDKKKEKPKPLKFVEGALDPKSYLQVAFQNNSHRFGITLIGERGGKRLTYSADGATNNTCLRLDGREVHFSGDGGSPSSYKDGASPGWRSVRTFLPTNVRVTQDVSVRRGQQSRKLDTCLVLYTLENLDTTDHQVGLRFMLDTLIGSNDGVPFTIPGRPGLVGADEFFVCDRPADLPHYIQALEHPNLTSPGTVAHLSLQLPDGLRGVERANEIRLVRWHGRDALWSIPSQPIGKDSSVVLYWPEKTLRRGESRRMAFTYGLGGIDAADGGGRLALTVGGSFFTGGQFTVTAYVEKPTRGQTVTLTLPENLRVIDKSPLKREVPVSAAHPISQVSWKVAASEEGVYTIKAELDNGATQSKQVTITKALED